MASATSLSQHDSHVLGALFDPESSLSTSCQIKDLDSVYYDVDTLSYLKGVERQALASVNTATPSNTDILRTIKILSRLIEDYPQYASAYNNRAEARRISNTVEELMRQPNTLSTIFADLDQAISLATPKRDLDPISTGDAAVLSSAHTHKAFLLYLASQVDTPGQMFGDVVDMAGRDREQLEECASKNFAAGGRFGNKLAKQLAVKTNPYAKLCGSIIKEAMRREFDNMRKAHLVAKQ